MRILHVSSIYPPDQIGGAEVMVAVLAETLAAKGHQVAVACASRNEETPTEQNGVIVYRTGYGTPFFILDRPLRSQLDRMRYKIAAKFNSFAVNKISAAICEFQPEIVNTHSLSELPPQIWPMAKNLGVSLVHTLHDYKSICTNGAMFRDGKACTAQHLRCRLISYPHYRCQFSVDAVTGVGTDILQRHLDANLFRHIPGDLRRVIWNPIDGKARARSRLRAYGDDVMFGFLGRIEQSKGTDMLLQACRELPAAGWKLLVAGRATDGLQSYETLAAGLPVEFVGFVDRDDFFNRIDCLVVPSIWPEAFGRTVAEAYARGVPVIGSRIAGIAEQIGLDAEEWLFPPGDRAALARVMAGVLAAPARLTRQSRAMLAVTARVAPQSIAESYLDLYRATIEQSAHSRRAKE
jgi:glycogen(starch) synthase